LQPRTVGLHEPDPGTGDGTTSIRNGGDGIARNIDTVRGLACLFIVALHAVGDTPSNGLRLPMTSDWHYAMESIEFLRIPLFTALSGYLYAGQRVTDSAVNSGIRRNSMLSIA
jgi:surface polysaccharide O-acyltransferase-like enzyme